METKCVADNIYAYSKEMGWRKVLAACSGTVKFYPYFKPPIISYRNHDYVRQQLKQKGYTVKCVDYPNLTYSEVIDILKSSS
jgi:hypothetical protein